MSEERFSEWAILELMGHRRLAGLVSEQEIGGSGFLRIDIPGEPGTTQFYSPSAVYALTPTSEETARRVAVLSKPEPVSRWELPVALPQREPRVEDESDDDDQEDERAGIPF